MVVCGKGHFKSTPSAAWQRLALQLESPCGRGLGLHIDEHCQDAIGMGAIPICLYSPLTYSAKRVNPQLT